MGLPYVIFSRAGFIKFVQLSALFRNALSYFNRTGYKINLLLFKTHYNILIFEYNNKNMNSAADLQNMQYNFGIIRDFSLPSCA
jgi:hypothetical protein